jgi:hypothetical protein
LTRIAHTDLASVAIGVSQSDGRDRPAVFGYRCPYWPARSRRNAVGVDLEPHLGFVAGAGEQLGKAGRVHGPPRFDKNTNGEAGDASAPAMLV